LSVGIFVTSQRSNALYNPFNSLSTVYKGWPKKVSDYQMIKNRIKIVLTPVNEITFIRQIKV